MILQFDQLLDFFYALNNPANVFSAFVAYLGAALIIIIMRVSLFLGYQAQRTIINFNLKPVKTLGELKDARPNILTKTAKDYVSLCESGITTADVKDIAQSNVDRLSFFWWSLSGILRFVEVFERSVVLVGLLLAIIFEPARIAFGLIAVALWLLLCLCAAIFDARLAGERLTSEITTYVSREAAKFFTPDFVASITALRNTLSNAIEIQSDSFASASRAMSESLSASISTSLGDMSRSIEHTLIRLADADTLLKEPLSRWNEQISSAAQLQSGANQSSERLMHVMTQFSDIAGTLAGMLGELEKHSPDKVVREYESTLEDLTRKLGDGFGTILDHHVTNALKELTDGLQDNLSHMVRGNQELTQTLRQIADRLDEQGRNEVRAIAAIKEQIDMRLDEIKQK